MRTYSGYLLTFERWAAHFIARSKLAALGDGLSTLAISMTRAGGQPSETAADSLPLSVLGAFCNAVSSSAAEV